MDSFAIIGLTLIVLHVLYIVSSAVMMHLFYQQRESISLRLRHPSLVLFIQLTVVVSSLERISDILQSFDIADYWEEPLWILSLRLSPYIIGIYALFIRAWQLYVFLSTQLFK